MRTIASHRESVAALLTASLPPRQEVLVLSADASAGESGDRMLAVDVTAALDVPGFDNSQMDGYAVRSAALVPGTPYPLTAEIPAGIVPSPLPAGWVAPIMTGAAIPPGADAVIPIEQASGGFADHAAAGSVTFTAGAARGDFIRPRGSDIAAGAVLLPAGTVLGAAQLGALVAAGVSAVRVCALPRVALVTTGLELTSPGEPLEAGHIHDSNSIMLAHALRRNGAVVAVHRYSSDEPSGLLNLLTGVAARSDLIVTTGAVSRGTREVVREVLDGDSVTFRSVAMQPGGPQGSGLLHTAHGAVPILCFPGNPVSAMVSFEMFLRPVLRRYSGRTPVDRPPFSVRLAHSVTPLAAKHQVRRGVLDADGRASFLGGPSSHLLTAYAQSNVLIHIPAGPSPLPAGTPVDVWRIDD